MHRSKRSLTSEESLAGSAARIKTALKTKAHQDEVIARELRAAKKRLKHTKAWLIWCREQFGWKKAMAHRHLNPKQMQKAREKERTRQAAQRKRSRLQPVDKNQDDDKAASDGAAATKRALAKLDRAVDDVVALARSLTAGDRRRVWQCGKQLIGVSGVSSKLAYARLSRPQRDTVAEVQPRSKRSRIA